MVRPADFEDIPFITTTLLNLRPLSGWACYTRPGFDEESLTQYVTNQLLNSQSVCVVYESGYGVTAFCGAQIHRFVLPPHMLVLYEWGWGGDKRASVRCWQAVREWGRIQGAELAGRTTARSTKSRHITEQMTWEIL